MLGYTSDVRVDTQYIDLRYDNTLVVIEITHHKTRMRHLASKIAHISLAVSLEFISFSRSRIQGIFQGSI